MGVLPLHFLAAIVQPGLGAVAADSHVAPQTAGIAASVEEQPVAIPADFYALEAGAGQQRQRRDSERGFESKRLAWHTERRVRRGAQLGRALQRNRAMAEQLGKRGSLD